MANPTSKLSGNEPGIAFRNEMGMSFQLARVLLVLDHHVLYDIGSWDGPVLPHFIFLSQVGQSPGEHLLQVLVDLRGLSSVNGYKLEVKSSHAFTVTNKGVRLEVVAWEKGAPTKPPEQRPAVRFLEAQISPRESRLPGTNGPELAPGSEAPAPSAADAAAPLP